MKSRAQRAATADLFAAAAAIAPAAPALRAPPPAPRPLLARSTPLWHAVVFSQLKLNDSSTPLERLCMHAQQFTSRVSVQMPDALLLEVKGSVKLFGSLMQLQAAIEGAWSGLKLPVQSATAPSALAALWLARAGERALVEEPQSLAGALAQLPIACTAWDEERLRTLRSMGITRMGELLRLPRAGLARRFGPDLVFDLDVALARQAAPRRTFAPRERFHERCDFEAPIETAAYLGAALQPLIGRCARFLRERQAGVEGLELRLRHRGRPDTRVRLGFAGITSELRRLNGVVEEKLFRLELAAPVRGMTLLSAALQPLPGDSLHVFAPGGAWAVRDTAPQLVERLRARLGEAAVYGIRAVAEHRPEAAWRRIDALPLCGGPPARGRSSPAALGESGARPVWLLDQPVLLFASEGQRLQGDLRLEQGPERIESGWWDGKDVERDYYRARARDGARLWVFQERQSRGWYLHGVFA